MFFFFRRLAEKFTANGSVVDRIPNNLDYVDQIDNEYDKYNQQRESLNQEIRNGLFKTMQDYKKQLLEDLVFINKKELSASKNLVYAFLLLCREQDYDLTIFHKYIHIKKNPYY